MNFVGIGTSFIIFILQSQITPAKPCESTSWPTHCVALHGLTSTIQHNYEYQGMISMILSWYDHFCRDAVRTAPASTCKLSWPHAASPRRHPNQIFPCHEPIWTHQNDINYIDQHITWYIQHGLSGKDPWPFVWHALAFFRVASPA